MFRPGPALAHDFLKECGCLWLAKPDSHLRNALRRLELVKDEKDAEKFADHLCERVHCLAKVVREELNDPSTTPYGFDKTIWLLCTGSFYFDNRPKNLSPRDLPVSSAIEAALETQR